MEDMDMPFVLFSDRSQLPALPGVYVVIGADNMVLYVGQTVNLQRRWAQHHRGLQMRNNYRIYWRRVAHTDLDTTEDILIEQLHPTLNGTPTPSDMRFDLPNLTRHQIRVLTLDLDADPRDIIIRAVAELWQREIGEAPRDLAAEIDEITARLNKLDAA